MNTHSSEADARMELLCAHAVRCGAPADLLKQILDCTVTQEAAKLLKEAGVEYLNIIAPENMMDVLPVVNIPTTYFLHSEGCVVGEPIVGAYVEEYPKRLEGLK